MPRALATPFLADLFADERALAAVSGQPGLFDWAGGVSEALPLFHASDPSR